MNTMDDHAVHLHIGRTHHHTLSHEYACKIPMPLTGAPHNIDETWALWVGETSACTPWGGAQKRAKEFGTMHDCKTRWGSSK
jgi:hypothetical protein